MTRRLHALVLAATCAALASACSTNPAPTRGLADMPATAGDPAHAAGYLLAGELPRSDLFLADAPRSQPPGSDDALAAQRAFADRGSPRWRLAALDAGLDFDEVAATFACSLGFVPSQEHTPNLAMLMQGALSDAGLATRAAKEKFNRARPFMQLEQASCTPGEEAFLRTNGSYPSGHAARGWALALVLAQVVPERQDALLRRGVAFGQSRVHCGVHWQSDVNAGRLVGAATFAALGNSPAFTRQAALARAEIRDMAARVDAPDAARCALERAALVQP